MVAKRWSGGTLRLRWRRHKAGYVLRQPSMKRGDPRLFPDDLDEGLPDEFREIRLFPIAGEVEEYEVALGESRIFAELLRSPETDEGFIEFSNKWGMLREYPTDKSHFLGLRRVMANAYEKKLSVNDLGPFLERLHRVAGPIAQANIAFGRKNKRSRPELMWYVRSLSEFCHLEFFQDLGGVSHVAKCAGCGRYFTRSSVKGPAPEHCSNACRQKLYRARLTTRHS